MDAPCCNQHCLQGRHCPRRGAAAPPFGPLQRVLAAWWRWWHEHLPRKLPAR